MKAGEKTGLSIVVVAYATDEGVPGTRDSGRRAIALTDDPVGGVRAGVGHRPRRRPTSAKEPTREKSWGSGAQESGSKNESGEASNLEGDGPLAALRARKAPPPLSARHSDVAITTTTGPQPPTQNPPCFPEQ